MPEPLPIPPGLFWPVPMRATPLPIEGVADYLIAGYMVVTGVKPGSRALLRNTLAIIALENANGAAIQNHNWGNMQANPLTWKGPAWMHPSPTPDSPLFFRQYPSHDAGVAAWWEMMIRQFPTVLRFAALDRPVEMVREMYRRGYVVGGDAKGYELHVGQLSEQYRREGMFRPLGLLRSDYVGIGALAAGVAGVVVAGVLNAGR